MNVSTRQIGWVLMLVILLMAGIVVRVYRLDTFPPGLYNDEAAYGMDGISVLNGEYGVFFERNNGREPLFIYLLALVFSFLGASPFTVRLTAALIGALTILTTYWMVHELFRFAPKLQRLPPQWFALWAASFLAFSYWHLSFSRLGFRAITLPLVMTVTFALLWRTWRQLRHPGRKPWPDAVAGGVALGLTLYTYTSGRMAFALFGATIAVMVLVAPSFELDRRRLLLTSAFMTGVAALVATPLLVYFALHPAYFAGHAAEVSIFNPKYSEGNPVGALINSMTKTVLMFLSEPDRNPRHNPAGIPVFDPFLAVWMSVGIIVAIFTWRRLTTIFSLFWFALFLTPAVFSAEGAPHSLRSIGLLPIVYVLPLFGIAWVIGILPARFSNATRWLPAPFLFVSAIVAIGSYFGAWTQIDRFRPAFFTDFVELAYAIEQPETPKGLWILPLPATEDLADGKLNTVDFLLKEPGIYTTLALSETTTPIELNHLVANQRQVFLLQTMGLPEHRRFQTKFADTRGLLHLLLRRNSQTPPMTGASLAGIPYTSYTLNDKPDFRLPDATRNTDATFGDVIRLTGINAGGAEQAAGIDGTLLMHADEPIWAVLTWQATEPITSTLKTSLILRDEAGNRTAQIDGMLAGNRYPLTTEWLASERASTYHLIELPQGTAPGNYTLELRVYADESGIVYPARTGQNSWSTYPIASITLLPARIPGGDVAPQEQVEVSTPTDVIKLIGFDPPAPTISPGDSLRLTLYFRAPLTPTADYTVHLSLVTANGTPVAEQDIQPGGRSFPTSAWRAGEFLRQPVALQTDAALPNGEYDLNLSLLASDQTIISKSLSVVTIDGRPRMMMPPPLTTPVQATFGDSVQLNGINAPAELRAAPGETIALTLIWQPLRTQTTGLVRFVQLLNSDGQLLAQQDTVPCDNQCPATSWVSGEYLVDTARLQLPAELPVGSYHLITGWYDLVSQQRLKAFTIDGEPLVDNAARLPITVVVTG